ncbi:MAG: hypothetical protein RR406_00115 [Bacilli bacterium]
MNYKVLCMILIVVTGLLSLVTTCLAINIRKMAKNMKNYTHKRETSALKRNLQTKICSLESSKQGMEIRIKKLEDEVEYFRNKMLDYSHAYELNYKHFNIACGTISDLLREGLLIKRINSEITFKSFFNDLVKKGYVEVYNPNGEWNVTKTDLLDIFGTSFEKQEEL